MSLDVAEQYLATFAGRQDCYALYDGQWACHREPLRPGLVMDAFRSGKPLSGYTVTAENTTHLAVYDFDDEDGLTQAKKVREAMARDGVIAYVETSRRGAHLWSVLDEVLPRRVVWRAMRGYLGMALVPESPKVEFRIAPRDLSEDSVGVCIRLPTMPNPKDGKRYPMLRADDSPISGNLRDLLLEIEWADADRVRATAKKVAPTLADLKPGDRQPYHGPATETSVSSILMSAWGLQAVPGRSVRCPLHDDKMPSLSVLRDDARVICKSPSCILYNDGRGRGSNELRRIAEASIIVTA